jgi:hypothetical protein
VKPSTPCFVAACKASPGTGESADSEAMLMMWRFPPGPFRISSTAARDP